MSRAAVARRIEKVRAPFDSAPERADEQRLAPLDPIALRAAIASLHVASFGWAMTCTGRHRPDAEDALQTAYEKVLAGRARFEGRSSFKTWLFGVIRLTAHEQRRRRRWLSLIGLGTGPEPSTRPAPAPQTSGDDTAERDEQTRAVTRAVARLTERQREVLHLVFYEEMTVREAADAMGLSAGAASVHYDRGKKNLAALLRAEGVER